MSGHIAPKGLYVTIFAALMVLTALTVGAAFVNLGAFSFSVALAIAIIKAVLVILIFMGVRYSTRLTWVVIGTGFFFLLILFALTLSDYVTRGWSTLA